jgi:osmotically-inducible protein OsmY
MGKTTTLSDHEIQHEVEQELEWDPRVNAAGIAATVKNGLVTLTGFVDTYAKKVAAVDAVHKVRGVLDVADEVQVRALTRVKADQEIAQAVRSALTWDVFVPEERIQSTVSAGWVVLEGNVDRWHQREDAGRAIERIAGVRGVSNRIEIKPPKVDAAKIRASIEGALMRRAEREANRLQVKVDDGVVTLRGTVDSWAEKNAIAQLANYSPGVARVVNDISIDAYA